MDTRIVRREFDIPSWMKGLLTLTETMQCLCSAPVQPSVLICSTDTDKSRKLLPITCYMSTFACAETRIDTGFTRFGGCAKANSPPERAILAVSGGKRWGGYEPEGLSCTPQWGIRGSFAASRFRPDAGLGPQQQPGNGRDFPLQGYNAAASTGKRAGMPLTPRAGTRWRLWSLALRGPGVPRRPPRADRRGSRRAARPPAREPRTVLPRRVPGRRASRGSA